MKKSLYFILPVFFIISNLLFAQDNLEPISLSLYAGTALPQGNFGRTDVQKAGFAKTGFCAIIEASKNLEENVNWITSVDLAVNNLNYTEIQNLQKSDVKVTAGNYLTTWIMTGIGCEF